MKEALYMVLYRNMDHSFLLIFCDHICFIKDAFIEGNEILLDHDFSILDESYYLN
jgi:hypothetical protein